MLDSERNSQETDNNNEAAGQTAGAAPAPTRFYGPAEPVTSGPVTSNTAPAVPAALFQPPQVLFQPPAPVAPPPAAERDSGDRDSGGKPYEPPDPGPEPQRPDARRRRR
jgi:hypothetical protein